jgi:ribonuclease BN (tRNA processing enzyme)
MTKHTTINILGSGSAFTMNNYQSNFLISRNEKNLLIDCGGDIRFSMRDFGDLNYLDVDGVYVSHAHADHIGGLEWLAFSSHFDPRYVKQPKLFGESEFIRPLWDKSLSGGLEGLEGIDAHLSTYFDVQPIMRNGFFEWEGIKFDIVQAIHVASKYAVLGSYGLMFTVPETGKRIYITTDVQFCPETSMKAYYKEADIILHDCETGYPSGVHAHYNMLKTLSPDIKKKMYLYHYQDNVLNDFDNWKTKAKNDGFLQFLTKGMSMQVGDPKFKPERAVVFGREPSNRVAIKASSEEKKALVSLDSASREEYHDTEFLGGNDSKN